LSKQGGDLLSLAVKELALKAIRLLQEKKAQDILLLEINKVSLIADYFLICSGTSQIHTKALCDHLLENIPGKERDLWHLEGYREGRWILLDFGGLVVHIFLLEERLFYNLERLWGEAEIVDLKSLPASLS
jgi:ribosome-associated protein